MKTLKIAVLLFFTSAMLTFAQTNWTFDKAHSKIGFSVSHLVITDVEGNFKEFDASVTTDGDNWENAKIEFTAEIASIDTDNEKRDEHLRSDDFFNAEKYPSLKFISKSFKKVDDNEYKLVGDLTIRDVTKEVELEVELNGTVVDPWGNTKAGFDLEGEINRFDYGLKWSKALETGGLVVGEDVEIIGKLQLMKK
jgi:polyisoprenoid-binding protein YceI